MAQVGLCHAVAARAAEWPRGCAAVSEEAEPFVEAHQRLRCSGILPVCLTAEWDMDILDVAYELCEALPPRT